MKVIAPILSWLALALLIGAPGVYLVTGEGLDTVKTVMLLATILWFAAASVWLWKKK